MVVAKARTMAELMVDCSATRWVSQMAEMSAVSMGAPKEQKMAVRKAEWLVMSSAVPMALKRVVGLAQRTVDWLAACWEEPMDSRWVELKAATREAAKVLKMAEPWAAWSVPRWVSQTVEMLVQRMATQKAGY